MLRIGVVEAGRIVDERVLGPRETLSVGTSERNSLVLARAGMPARFELFQFVDGEYVLNFTDTMSGRVVIPAGSGELAELRGSGHARDAGGYRQVRLDDRSRGRVTIAGATLLFQFVDPPAVVVRPQLPTTVMGGFGNNVDWTFTAFVSASFIFFFGFGLYLSQLDPLVDSGIAALPDDLAHLVYDEPPPPEVEQEIAQEATEGDNPSEQASNESSASEHSDSASSDHASGDVVNDSAAQASLADSVAQQVVNDMISSLSGDSALGTFRDTLAGGTVAGNMGDVLQSATGTGDATGTGRTGAIREAAGGGGSGTTGNLGTLAAGSGPRASGDPGTGPAQVQVRRGSVRSGASTEVGGTGTFDASQVSGRLRGLSASINRCYEQQLATNPSLEGRVAVQFTITESGTVSGVQVDAPSAALGSCVQGVLSRMRFNPAPVGGSVRYSTAFVFSSAG